MPMPYEGEYAGYRALQRLADADRVKQLLSRARAFTPSSASPLPTPQTAPTAPPTLPEFVVAIDGSHAEVEVRNGYPSAKVGYLSVASVLLDVAAIDALDEQRPVDPSAFRQTEQAASIDAALPGSNVVTRTHTSARIAFREEIYDVFHSVIVDSADHTPLLDTFEALLALKPAARPQRCPYELDTGCTEHLNIGADLSSCICADRLPIWSTDALRIHEAFRDTGTNGEAFGETMQVWERILLVHILRAFERGNLLGRLNRLAFFIDGPLALFGHPAWLSAAISRELQRINAKVRELTGHDLVIVGVEKSGEFVTHFEEVDQSTTPGKLRFAARDWLLPTDAYIKERIIFSTSTKRYGLDTYFGRKFFYKTTSGARIVASIPFLNATQDTLASSNALDYESLPTVFALLDKLVSSRFQNALSPIVSAHAHAAIPLNLGAKVLEQLANALMRDR
jgi:hypothetical protein